MTKLKQLMLALVLAAPVLAAPVAAEMKIAVVDPQQAFETSEPAQAYKKELDRRFGKELNSVKKQVKKLQEQDQKLKKDAPTLSQAEGEKRVRELQRMNEDLMVSQESLQKKMRAYEQKKGKQAILKSKLQDALQQVAKDGGYDLILLRGNVLYAKPEHDITKEVVERFNQIAR